MSSAILEIKNLSLRRQKELSLENVTLSLHSQRITGLTGPNGGGKSSLFETLLGQHRVEKGEICWNGKVRTSYLAQQIPTRKLLPLSVLDFVKMATWTRDKEVEAALDLEEALEDFEIAKIAHQRISEISGGQLKRAAMARCFVQRADLYLLDEPFNHLDLETEKKVGQLLRRVVEKRKKTFFVISHDWQAMDEYFDHLILLNRRVIAEGSVKKMSEISLNWRDPAHHEWMHHRC